MPVWKVLVKAKKEVPVDAKNPQGKTKLIDRHAETQETHLSGNYKTAADVKRFAESHWKHLNFVGAELVSEE